MNATETMLYSEAPEMLLEMARNDFAEMEVKHLYDDGTGTAALVFDLPDGTRHYWAHEFTIDGAGTHDADGNPVFDNESDWYLTDAYGYHTTEKHHYMGERYRGLWGEFESEVYSRP